MPAETLPSCPSLEELEVFLAGGSRTPRLTRHVAACSRCRELLVDLRRNNDLLARLADGGVTPPTVENAGRVVHPPTPPAGSTRP